MEFPQSFPNVKREKKIIMIELGITSLLKHMCMHNFIQGLKTNILKIDTHLQRPSI
jgi:hypothetical protein